MVHVSVVYVEINYVKLQLWLTRQNGCNVKRPGLACSCVADFTVAGGGISTSQEAHGHIQIMPEVWPQTKPLLLHTMSVMLLQPN